MSFFADPAKRSAANRAARHAASYNLSAACCFGLPCLATVAAYAFSDIRLPLGVVFLAGYAGVMATGFALVAIGSLFVVALTES